MSPLTLIVDDYADSAEMLSLTLSTLGVECITAASGAAALTLIEQRRPTAGILDLKLPDADGFEIAGAFRRSPDPVVNQAILVAYTGLQTASFRAQATDAGFDYYVLKPCDAELLTACLELGDTRHLAPLIVPPVNHVQLEALSARSRAALQRARELVSRYPWHLHKQPPR